MQRWRAISPDWTAIVIPSFFSTVPVALANEVLFLSTIDKVLSSLAAPEYLSRDPISHSGSIGQVA